MESFKEKGNDNSIDEKERKKEIDLITELVKVSEEKNKHLKRISNNVTFFFWFLLISFGISFLIIFSNF